MLQGYNSKNLNYYFCRQLLLEMVDIRTLFLNHPGASVSSYKQIGWMELNLGLSRTCVKLLKMLYIIYIYTGGLRTTKLRNWLFWRRGLKTTPWKKMVKRCIIKQSVIFFVYFANMRKIKYFRNKYFKNYQKLSSIYIK